MSQDYAAPAGVTVAAVVETPAPYSLFTRLAAEAFGTFILVLGIVGTATFNALNQGSILTVALAGGIMLMAAVAAVGHVSGGHFNPAVTLGLALAGRAAWKDVLPYWLAQFVGAAVTAVVLWAIIPSTFPALLGVEGKGGVLARTANGWGEHSPLSGLAQGQSEFGLVAALLVEIIIAAVFVGVILGTTDKRAKLPYPPVVIGLTLAALHIISWPVTNTSFNPARSFASALFAGDGSIWGQQWLFLVAPLVGGGLAALFYRAFTPVDADALDSAAALDELEETYDVEPAGDELVEPEHTEVAEPAAVEAEAPVQAERPEAGEQAEQGTEGTTKPEEPKA